MANRILTLWLTFHLLTVINGRTNECPASHFWGMLAIILTPNPWGRLTVTEMEDQRTDHSVRCIGLNK